MEGVSAEDFFSTSKQNGVKAMFDFGGQHERVRQKKRDGELLTVSYR